MILLAMAQGKSFKESLKALEADIQHANTLASEFPRDYDGACLQMRLSYGPAAHFFLFLVRWTDCSLAGALGLLRILIYKVYMDGTTTMSTYERKASFHEFYGMLFSIVQALRTHGLLDLLLVFNFMHLAQCLLQKDFPCFFLNLMSFAVVTGLENVGKHCYHSWAFLLTSCLL